MKIIEKGRENIQNIFEKRAILINSNKIVIL